MQHLQPMGLQGFDDPVEYQANAHGRDKEADDSRDGVDARRAKTPREPPGEERQRKVTIMLARIARRIARKDAIS